MHNTSLSFPLNFLPSSPFLHPPPHANNSNVMFFFLSFSYLSLILLLLHIFSFFLIKFFSSLYNREISKRDDKLCISQNEKKLLSSPISVSDELYSKQNIISDIILGGDTLLFLYGKNYEKDTLLEDKETDSKEQIPLSENDCFVQESEYDSPLENISVWNPTNNVENEENLYGENCYIEEESESNGLKNEDFKEKDKLFSAENQNFKAEQIHQEGDSLAGESTSKSSIEWRSSTIFRDSETDCPFSSSSRRSSSNWEFYTLFKKYDEEMFFFDRFSAQKLAETESFRLINAQPRSISKRIVGKLIAKPRSNSMRLRDPYQDLETAYVAQICLAWEALNWNYNIFRRLNGNKSGIYGSVCRSEIAQKFQQFEVLLQRFIENEPYEYGRRPEIFARMRLSSPKLLQVPEFLGLEGEELNLDMDSEISSVEFLTILEDAIQTFMKFLKADKKTACERFKALMKRKQSTVDQTYLRLLKKINKKKKMRLEEIGRWQKYSKKGKPKEEEEMEIFMAIVDMKVVSRVLRVEQITEEQLHWCEDKMSKVRVWNGKMQRDQSTLFFPVH